MKFARKCALCALMACFGLICFAWAGARAGAKAESCANSMKQVWAAAKSYHLEHRLSEDALVEPEKVAVYLKDGAAPRCPAGKKPYAPFSYKDGPVCPNDAKHTERLRAR